MKNAEQRLEDWMGTESIELFETEEEVRAYFTAENATKMWGPDGDYSDAEDVLAVALELWREWKKNNSSSDACSAQKIKDAHKSFTDQLIAADEQCSEKEQDWDAEMTIFKFEDGSELVADGVDGECRVREPMIQGVHY